ncbi:MAG: TonB-dependent receptor plug domain-containing protein [Saprospiraceae bacterium]|nr:TonB-dependent receptor plug domain-containing protein [Saprospiraceae bacterium]
MKRLKTLLFLGCCVGQSIALAQYAVDTLKNYDLVEFVITGTRTERSVATLPSPVQVISAEAIQKSGVSRLNEIIQEQTGLITVPFFNGGEGIQLQGLDAAYVMILIDGQPLVGRNAGMIDLSRITVNNIERIEIIKGASSSLYGSEALAGVVNIITKKLNTDGDWKLNVNYRLATFNTNDANASIRYGKNKIAFELFGNYFNSQGYDLGGNNLFQTVEPFYNYTIQPKFKIQLSEKIEVVATTRYYAQNQENRTVIDGTAYEGESIIEEWNNSVFINQKINDQFKIVYDLYATNYKTEEYLNDVSENLFEESFYDQWFFRPEVRTHWRKGLNVLTTGIGMNYETMDRTYFTTQAQLSSEYIFAQYEWFLKKNGMF